MAEERESAGGHAAVRAKASSTLASLQAQLKGKGKGFNKLEADKKEGTGHFSASKGSALAANGGDASPRGCGASSSDGGAALGGAAGVSNVGSGTDAATSAERKPWWLCCC